MARPVEFRKLIVDGVALKELIVLRKSRQGLLVPSDVMEKLKLKGIELVDATDMEAFDYLQNKWR